MSVKFSILHASPRQLYLILYIQTMALNSFLAEKMVFNGHYWKTWILFLSIERNYPSKLRFWIFLKNCERNSFSCGYLNPINISRRLRRGKNIEKELGLTQKQDVKVCSRREINVKASKTTLMWNLFISIMSLTIPMCIVRAHDGVCYINPKE